MKVEKQCPISIYFQKHKVGNYKVDLMIEGKVLIELKAVSKLIPEHEAQIINYLKASKIDFGLLMNFGDKPEFKRFVFEEKKEIVTK